MQLLTPRYSLHVTTPCFPLRPAGRAGSEDPESPRNHTTLNSKALLRQPSASLHKEVRTCTYTEPVEIGNHGNVQRFNLRWGFSSYEMQQAQGLCMEPKQSKLATDMTARPARASTQLQSQPSAAVHQTAASSEVRS